MNDLELNIPTQINLATIILRKSCQKIQLDVTFRILKHTIILYIFRDFIPMYEEVHGINNQFHKGKVEDAQEGTNVFLMFYFLTKTLGIVMILNVTNILALKYIK